MDIPVVPALTLQCHPEPERIGERALLGGLLQNRPVRLSRNEPEFFAPGAAAGKPLEDPYISRQPLCWEVGRDGTLTLDPGARRTQILVDGDPVTTLHKIPLSALEDGVVIEISGRITLLLHLHVEVREQDRDHRGLVGCNSGMKRLREEIRRLADLRTPVLIRGATGTGKELVARALHDAGPRSAGPFVGVNLGALPPSLAAAELFGAARGAYTGAHRDAPGYFRRARGGTLFLDEVGEAPAQVQVMLLRVLESGEVQPLGAAKPERVEARIIAATDANLEAQARRGGFREPLIHRLSGYVLWLPPLRERRDDIGRLFLHFLRQELAETGEEWRLGPPKDPARPWLPAALMGRLLRFDWPGNVRQLRNIVRQLVIGSRGRSRLRVTAGVEQLLREEPGDRQEQPKEASLDGEAAPSDPATSSRRPSEISTEELARALRQNRWELAATARTLEVSRPSLYNLIREHPRLRTAGDLSPEEIRHCHRECAGNLDAMVERLEISRSALARRIRELGLG